MTPAGLEPGEGAKKNIVLVGPWSRSEINPNPSLTAPPRSYLSDLQQWYGPH